MALRAILASVLILGSIHGSALAEGGKHSGSAQPYVGYVLMGPFILRRADSTMIVEVALRFKPELDEMVRATVMDKTLKDVLRMRLYETSVTSFLDNGTLLRRSDHREELRYRIRRDVDRLLTFEGTEEVSFTRYEIHCRHARAC